MPKILRYERKNWIDLPAFGIVHAHKITGMKNAIEIELSNPGRLSFVNLQRVSEYFGTVEISWNSYHVEGCPTCGGEDITDFRIYNITKNNPFLRLKE